MTRKLVSLGLLLCLASTTFAADLFPLWDEEPANSPSQAPAKFAEGEFASAIVPPAVDAVDPAFTVTRDELQLLIEQEVARQRLQFENAVSLQGEKAKGAAALSAAADPAKSAPKYPIVDVTGFAQIDGVLLQQDAASQAVNTDIADFADFRRARLAAKGQLAENVGYYLEMDFAFPGRPSFMDVWVELQKIPVLGTVRIGQFRQPFSMDALTSVRDLTFLERSLPFIAFVPFRQIGVESFNTALDEQMTWAASVYRFPTDIFGNALGDSGYGTSYRVTGIPIYDEQCNHVLHLGAGYSFNDPGEMEFPAGVTDNNVIRYRTTPEIGFTFGDFFNQVTTGPFFADTGAIRNVLNTNLFDLEFAYANGPFLLQAEFMDALVSQRGGSSYNFTGAYTQASYVLTGECRKYNRKQGCFGRLIPNNPLGRRGCGAWEVAGRWSYVDLNDTPNAFNPLNPSAAIPAMLTDLTLGVNWYWNQFAKMQFNFIHAFQNVNGGPNTNTNIVALRTQFDF